MRKKSKPKSQTISQARERDVVPVQENPGIRLHVCLIDSADPALNVSVDVSAVC